MSEGLLTDSETAEGQAETAPAEEGNDFAFPAEETQATAPTTANEQTGSADADPRAATSDEGSMLRADYTRKTQDLADARRDFAQEQQQARQEREQDRQHWENRFNALNASLNPEKPGVLARALDNPELSAEDRAGLQYLQAGEQEAQALRENVTTLSSQMEEMQGRLNWAYQHLEGQYKDQRGEADREVQEQFAEADKAFGAETTQRSTDVVRALWNKENPQTGAPYTIKEIVAMANNIPAEQAQSAVSRQANGRTQAKRAVSAPQTSPANVPQEGPLSEAEAMAVIKSTM